MDADIARLEGRADLQARQEFELEERVQLFGSEEQMLARATTAERQIWRERRAADMDRATAAERRALYLDRERALHHLHRERALHHLDSGLAGSSSSSNEEIRSAENMDRDFAASSVPSRGSPYLEGQNTADGVHFFRSNVRGLMSSEIDGVRNSIGGRGLSFRAMERVMSERALSREAFRVLAMQEGY